MNSLENKVAIVTGGTSGIGRAAAVALAAAGAKVVVAGRREKEGAETIELISKAGGTGLFVRTDVTKESDLAALVQKTVEKFGRLDIAFNNAGAAVEKAMPVTEVTEEAYRKLFDINVWGILAAIKHEVPAMLKNGGGSIINTSSVGGQIGMPTAAIYVATKHAVEGITRTAALELAKQGIRVNAVAPAAIETDMIDQFVGKEGPMRDYLTGLHPIGRMGKPSEVADAVVWLASDQSSFVTGHSLLVDGGFTAQ
ncbi:glucose 1-dehydrogenase [bacterium]|nr:glucose 1-dehydrogenase [bacterium]